MNSNLTFTLVTICVEEYELTAAEFIEKEIELISLINSISASYTVMLFPTLVVICVEE